MQNVGLQGESSDGDISFFLSHIFELQQIVSLLSRKGGVYIASQLGEMSVVYVADDF